MGRPSIVALALLFFLVYEAFIWGLPKYAQWQYDLKLGDENHTIFENYCWTPAEHIVCGWNPHTGHQTYKEIVDNNPNLFVFGTLLVFQVAYGGFLSFTWCVAHKYHGEVTKFMLVAVLFHWIFVSIGVGWKTLPAKLLTGTIWFLVIVAI